MTSPAPRPPFLRACGAPRGGVVGIIQFLVVAALLVLPARAEGLDLRGVLQLAASNHPDLVAAGLVVTGADERPEGALLPFVPRLVLQTGAAEDQNAVYGGFFTHFVGQPKSIDQRMWLNVGVAGRTPFGTDLALTFDNGAAYSNIFGTGLSPAYAPALRLSISQPLLRNVMPSAMFAPYDVARAARGTAGAQENRVRQSVMTAAAEGYLELARADALLELRQTSLELARGLLALSNELVTGGQLSRLDLALGEQQVASQETALSQARANRELAARALATRAGLPQDAPALTLAPRALEGALRWPRPTYDAERAGKLAVERSPDLAALRADRARIDAQKATADANALPDVRINVQARTAGLSGESTCKGGFFVDGLTPCFVPDEFTGGYDRALGGMATGQLYGALVSLEGDIPTLFGPMGAEARALTFEARAVEERIHARERALVWDARQLHSDVQARAQIVELAQRVASLARDAVSAEEQKLRAGRSTSLALQQAQQLLVDARAREIDALFDLGRSTVRYLVLLDELRPETLASSP